MSSSATPHLPPARRATLGIVFLTLYIDLVGFSIFFPLVPALMSFYLGQEGSDGLLAGAVKWLQTIPLLGAAENSRVTEVLFAGVLGSLYSLMQFLFSPIWGAQSDRVGRRSVLLRTIFGTAFSYALWAISGSFLMFVATRILGGIMSGNLSVATAAVADITTRENRSKGMAVVGLAFGLGFITGPALGGYAARFNLLEHYPALSEWGVNPFTVPALLALLLCGVNWLWVYTKFSETLPEGGNREIARERKPLRTLLQLPDAQLRRANVVYLLFALLFSGMELTLGFLAAERLGFTAKNLHWVFVFIGCMSVVSQGFLVRRLMPKLGEKTGLLFGVSSVAVGFLALSFANSSAVFFGGLAFLSIGSSFTNVALSSLVSLLAPVEEQGRALGVFRSLGSLARAVGPFIAGVLYWLFGSLATYALGAALLLVPLFLACGLRQPKK